MTIQEYFNDTNKSAQENQQTHDFYTGKLNEIMAVTKKPPSVTIYYEGDDLWFHFKIPDQEKKGLFFYDVVFVFYPPSKKAVNEEGTILNYKVKFFANDPGFMFKYCYEFNQANLIVDPLKTRLSSKALNEPAKQMNPTHELRYPKTIYFAYLTMENLALFDKKNIQAQGVTKLQRSFFVQHISTSQSTYNKLQTINKTSKGINKVVQTVTKPIDTMTAKISKSVSSIGNFKKTKSSGAVKSVSGSKKVKRK